MGILFAFTAMGHYLGVIYALQATHFFDGAPKAPKHRFTPFVLCARSLASVYSSDIALHELMPYSIFKSAHSRHLKQHGASRVLENVVGARTEVIFHPECIYELKQSPRSRNRGNQMQLGDKYATRLARRFARLTFSSFGSPSHCRQVYD